MNTIKKSVKIAVGALLASAASIPLVHANSFGYSELPGGYQQADQLKQQPTKPPKEHKCGEGKCGEDHRAELKKTKTDAKETTEKVKTEEHKCGEGKCGEGKCGGV